MVDKVNHVALEFGSSGCMVLIEPELRKGLVRRVFREVNGGWEWSSLADWRESGERARFYGWGSKELPASMVNK